MSFFMFSRPESIRYANQYNRVFVLDCDYKKNRYSMLLLLIIYITPSNSTVSIAFRFRNQEENYA